jgi:pimeloyl-ACP methyl ester carboxylesterase
MTNLLPTNPLTFRVPLDILSDSLPALGAFPIDGNAEDAPHFDGPALFIKGSHSGYIQEKNYPVMRRLFPKMEVVEFEGSHWIHVDQPVDVSKTMYATFTLGKLT